MRAIRNWAGPLLLALSLPVPAAAHHAWDAAGSLVGVTVEVDGWTAPLYPAPDGSGRMYVEARAGARYAVQLANRTRERLGVVLVVDGLNVISGERDPGPDRSRWSRPGRMYVLDPWESTRVAGWRSSLDDVRQFTFVDERASYAARSGKANGKMGWIEVVVYRERRPWAWLERRESPSVAPEERERDDWARSGEGRAAPSAPAPTESADEGKGRAADRAEAAPLAKSGHAQAAPESRAEGMGRRSYPGTGWGDRAYDPVTVVTFEPESRPAESVTLRYEYASALRALGIGPRSAYGRDRLAERERGRDGFAKPPRW